MEHGGSGTIVGGYRYIVVVVPGIPLMVSYGHGRL